MIGKRKKWLQSGLAAAIVLALALLGMGVAQSRRVHALTLQVNAAYQKAFYEAVELMGGVQLNLEKLQASANSARQQALLTAIVKQAEGAQDNLAAMPGGHETIAGTLKFVNQIGDYAHTLGQRLAEGAAMSAEDFSQIDILHAHCAQLNAGLIELMEQYERGEIVFTAETLTDADASFTESPPAVEYPVLLYDGPFSDGRDEGEMLGLGTTKYTREEAEEALRAYIGEDRVTAIRYSSTATRPTPCYEFEADTADGVLTAGVTELGGRVLYMLPESGVAAARLSQAECIDLADRFLRSRGYGDMLVSYWRQLDGILTVNFAAVQEGVLLYPDLVKVQISMQSGLVVGVEAGNYLRNHVLRTLATPTVSMEDALRRISDQLSVERTRLCLIPTDAGEVLCWEASSYLSGGDRYLIYINALTGQEQTILRVTQDDSGYVTQ